MGVTNCTHIDENNLENIIIAIPKYDPEYNWVYLTIQLLQEHLLTH